MAAKKKQEGPARAKKSGRRAAREGTFEEPAAGVAARHFDLEEGLIELPGAPARSIWAFTCPALECGCRTAIVLSTSEERDALRRRGRAVAEAWLDGGGYHRIAQDLEGVTAFAIDLDSRELYSPVRDTRLDAAAHPEVQSVIDRIDDDVLDAIARIWHRGKGAEPPADPGAGGSTIEIEDFGPGDLVTWDETRSSLRGDTYVFGERVFEAIEFYCVEPDCDCGDVIVTFSPIAPRGAPRPGHVELDGTEVTLRPDNERQGARLNELWSAYSRRHPRSLDRLARRSAVMHGLAGRIVAAPRRPKVGRNGLCPCGSGKNFKKCCAAA